MGGPDDPAVIEAKALCKTCPMIFMCRQQGRDGQEWGVWGGESHIERNRLIARAEEETVECGTYRALQMHRLLGEKCEVCQEARRERERAYDAKRREGKKLVKVKKPIGGFREKSPCPSYGAYKRHIKRKEDPGPCGCREAYRIARKAERDAQPKKERDHTPCPSSAGYRRHQRRGEAGIECGCREASRKANSKSEKAKRKAGAVA
jgi:hypothetical protein